MPKHQKEFYDYIVEGTDKVISLQRYVESPAVAFLKYVINAKDASNMCLKQFKKTKARGTYTKDALENIQCINAGLLAAIMGNFETYQKYLFARMFEHTIYLNKFDIKSFIKALNNSIDSNIVINIERFSAYRDSDVSVGLILADNLKNWQAPRCVNRYFKAFNLVDLNGHKLDIYSNHTIETLDVLWQMRHSIVHTAGTITIPDAQKIEKLHNFGNKVILLEPNFIYEVARKLHPIIKQATTNMKNIFIHNLNQNIDHDTRRKIENIFKVSSSCSVWLKD